MKVLKTAIVKTTRFLNLNVSRFEHKGKEGDWFWVERVGSKNAVVIVALTEDDRLVVTKEFRVPIEGYEWGLPAGLIDNRDTPEWTARRELEEETGLSVDGFLKNSSSLVYNSPGMTNEAVYMVYVRASGQPHTGNLEEAEDIETFFMNREEVKELMQRALNDTGIMIGAKAWMVFDRYVKHGDV